MPAGAPRRTLTGPQSDALLWVWRGTGKRPAAATLYALFLRELTTSAHAVRPELTAAGTEELVALGFMRVPACTVCKSDDTERVRVRGHVVRGRYQCHACGQGYGRSPGICASTTGRSAERGESA